MKWGTLFIALLWGQVTLGHIIGEDNRQNLNEVIGQKYVTYFKSTASIIPSYKLESEGNSFNIKASKLSDLFQKDIKTYGRVIKGAPLCEGERFQNEAVAANCNGVLIGADQVLTAKHCMYEVKEASTLS